MGQSDPLFDFHRSKEDLDATATSRGHGNASSFTGPEISYRDALAAWLDVPNSSHSRRLAFYESGSPAKDESEPSVAAGKLATEPALKFIRDTRADIAAELPGLALPYYEKIDAAVEGLLNHELFQPADDAGRALKDRHLNRLQHHAHRDARSRRIALANAGIEDAVNPDDAIDPEED